MIWYIIQAQSCVSIIYTYIHHKCTNIHNWGELERAPQCYEDYSACVCLCISIVRFAVTSSCPYQNDRCSLRPGKLQGQASNGKLGEGSPPLEGCAPHQ